MSYNEKDTNFLRQGDDMRNGIRAWFLVLVVLGLPSLVMAQNVDIEFESYGSCPLYLVPGTDDYDLCRDQQRQYDDLNGRTAVRYEDQGIDLNAIQERRDDERFNVRERYE